MKSCDKSHCREKGRYLGLWKEVVGQSRGYSILVNESSLYSMSQAWRHHRHRNSPRMVCNPKLMVQERVWKKNGGNNIPEMSLCFAFNYPQRVIWVWNGQIFGGAIGKKTLNCTWISEIPEGAHLIQRDMVWMGIRPICWEYSFYLKD